MTVNVTEQKFFAELEIAAKANPPKPLSEQTLAEFREGANGFLDYAGASANISVFNTTIAARDGYQIPIRIYNNDLPAKSAVLIMFPGCGYIVDLFESNAIAASRIAKFAGIKVIMVNFRLAPENPLPTSIYDGFDVTKYVAIHANDFNIDPDKIFVGGLSSGGHCAAAVTNLARKDPELKIFHQILLNSCFDLTRSNHEYDSYEKEDKMLNQETVAYIFKTYGLQPEDYTKPIFSPFYDDLSDLPSTTIMVGEYDGIRNDSEAYYKKLKAAGNQVEKIILQGQTHNTIILRGVISDGEDPAAVVSKVIQKKLGVTHAVCCSCG